MTRITPLSDAIHSLDRELGPLDTVTAQEAVDRSGERFAKLVFKAPPKQELWRQLLQSVLAAVAITSNETKMSCRERARVDAN